MPDFRQTDFGWGMRYTDPRWPELTPEFKGPGFASGVYPDGTVLTEWGATAQLGTDRMQNYPTVYQGIFPWELEALMNESRPQEWGYQLRNKGPVISTDPLLPEIKNRAYESALYRAMMGLSPYLMEGDETQSDLLYHRRVR